MWSWWPLWGKRTQEPTKVLTPPVAPPPPVDFREEFEKQQRSRYEIFQKLKAVKTESARKHREDPETFPTPLTYFYQEGVTTKEERGIYAEVLTMLVIKQASREDKRFDFVQGVFCTDKHSATDSFGADVMIVTSFGIWIPVQVKRTKMEADEFREESRRRGEIVPVVCFNDNHSERQILDSVFQEIHKIRKILERFRTETVGQR